MKIKIAGQLAANAADALTPHAHQLFANQAARRLVVAELKHAERNDVAPDEDKEASVTLRVAHLEVANAEQEETLRAVLRALHLHRTAYGTLDEEGEIELAESTLEGAADQLNAVEAARLHVAIDRWVDHGRDALRRTKGAALVREIDKLLTGLAAAVGRQTLGG
jgi:hypothetical protein